MILITGAGGKTGQAVVRALVGRGAGVTAQVRRPEQTARFEQMGAAATIAAELLDLDDMRRAMAGIETVYLIAPNVHPEEIRIGEVAVAAARAAGVERIVYHSVLHPQTREMPHHWSKLAVEELLLASGLGFTVLQPCAYMQNVLGYRRDVEASGVYRVPYGDEGALSLVDLEDVATAAARVLTEGGHDGATYELAGPEALTPTEIAHRLGELLDRPISAGSERLDDWIGRNRSAGLADEAIDALSKMFRYYDRHGLRGNPRILEFLLDREPTKFATFLAREWRARD